MNIERVDSLVQMIKSLTPEEKALLEAKMQAENSEDNRKKFSGLASSISKNDLDKWLSKLHKWSERHPQNIPLLSDYAISRSGIYEED